MSTPHIPSARERDERLRYWLHRVSSMEIASEIVDRWANHEMGPLDIPKGRLWILKQEIAEAIRRERRPQRLAPSAATEALDVRAARRLLRKTR